MNRPLFFTFLIFIVNPTFSSSQIKIDASFEHLLKKMQISYNEPVEDNYQTTTLSKNNVFNCDFAIKARKADLEIRYTLVEFSESENDFSFPHIMCMNMANHIAINDENAEIIVQHVAEKDLNDIFNADWAATFYFTPKHEFSNKKNCKMLALYKEGKGIAYVFFLFNKSSIELDNQFYSLIFIP